MASGSLGQVMTSCTIMLPHCVTVILISLYLGMFLSVMVIGKEAWGIGGLDGPPPDAVQRVDVEREAEVVWTSDEASLTG